MTNTIFVTKEAPHTIFTRDY